MSSLNENEVDAVGAATDLEDAKASGPATSVIASPAAGQDQPDASAKEDEDRGKEVDHIDGAKILDDCLNYLKRYVVPPSEAAGVLMVSWVAHTHLIDAFDTTPRLAFLSPEPSCGKTRAMEIVALMCPLALETSNASSASLMRAMEDPAGLPTFFIDEIDTVYGKNGKGDENLRGLVNAGHRRGKGFLRCAVGEDGNYQPQRFEVFAAVAMAGIGNLPDTILSRSVRIPMRRRAKHEKVQGFRHRDDGPEGEVLRERLARWAKQVVDLAKALRPDLPDEISDRNADVYEPLIVVGDLAGGLWSERVRDAAVEFVRGAKAGEGLSLGVQLLRDLKSCFGNEELVATGTLLERLVEIETGPWGDLSGKPLDPIRLALLLRDYGIAPGTIRLGTETPKGYKRADFHDAWERYVPQP